MKVLAINGSPRKNGNTQLMIEEVFKPLQEAGIETEIYQIGGKQVHGCTACMSCREKELGHCHIKNDAINECLQKMIEADGIIIGSPVYFSNVTTEIKALIDCAGYVLRADSKYLKHKVGAGIAVARRAGEMQVFNAINAFFLVNQMYVSGSSYWNIGIGKNPGDVLNDEEGMQTMKSLGENMAYLLNKLK
jgi:multimeric flavodoxin WrbA